MKILNLIMKGAHFNSVLNETKKKETREIRHKNMTRYCLIGESKAQVYIKPYDAIRMYLGYNKNRPSLLIEVVDANLIPSYNNALERLISGENKNYDVTPLIEYKLGKILETLNC